MGDKEKGDKGKGISFPLVPHSPLPILESFLAPECVTQQENMSRRPQAGIDRDYILGHQLRGQSPARPKIREEVRRVFARASARFGQAETRKSPSKEIGKEIEIGRVRFPDDQRRRAGEQLAPDVCLQSRVRGYVAFALSPILDHIPGRVLAALPADAREAEGEVPAQDGRSPQSESQAEAGAGATHAGPRGRVREDRAPNLSIALAP